MKSTKENGTPTNNGTDNTKPANEKLSRREFAMTSVAAGAAAAIPGVASATSQSTGAVSTPTKQLKDFPAGTSEWQEGMTIPAEYYYQMEHYLKDERIVGEQFWLMADHVSRIPEPGDFFVFKFGLGQSVIVVRGEDNEIRALHNVCRHRGSRLCKHDEDPQFNDDRLSVKQLGESGNAQFFRCPYHAWMYDLDGSLMDAYGMHDGFKMEENGLIPCHMHIESGHIFLNFSRAAEPPPFDNGLGYGFRDVASKWPIADLKVGTRRVCFLDFLRFADCRSWTPTPND